MGAHGVATPTTADERPDLAIRAGQLRIVDALLFRRVSASRWAHIGGLGRGRGWAGIVDIDADSDPLASHIPEAIGAVTRITSTEPARVIGPYYATDSVVVRLGRDVAVLLGNPTGSLADVDDDHFRQLANVVDADVVEVLPSKRLADEIEVLHTVRDLMRAPVDRGLTATLQYLLDQLAIALSCEIGVFRGHDGAIIATPADSGITEHRWGDALDSLLTRASGGTWCAQDMTALADDTLASLLPSARSVMAIPVPPPLGGIIAMIHTAKGPRGFSTQCRTLSEHVIEAGDVIIRTAQMHDDLRAAADRAAHDARTDPLTGLGNRLAWDEALASAQESVAGGDRYSVITIDLDGLKDINDRYGHNAGDDLLRRCAETIRAHCSERDLAVRMGGDEFAILVPRELTDTDPLYTGFVAELGERARSTRQHPAASVGLGAATSDSSIFDAVRDADVAMYVSKRQRRGRRTNNHRLGP